MKNKGKRFVTWGSWLLLLLLVVPGGGAPAQAGGEIGITVDKKNVAEYRDLLFPALYRAVERGDFILKTGHLNYEYKLDAKFLAASEKNVGKFEVSAAGDLIDKGMGKPPKYNIYGFPFPHIDPSDPQRAVKHMWNFNYMKYRFMASRASTRVSWISNEAGEHRWIGDPETLLYCQGRPPGQELKNPDNFLSMEIKNVLEPMSMKGTNVMAWDYFDERDITEFAYIPVFRRVRQTSGAARSDPFQGTDLWNDLGHGWSGKNRSMAWKLTGERTIFVPFSTLNKTMLEVLPDGTAKKHVVDIKWGFNTPGWKGAKWAPTTVTWVPRKVWVIEQMPKDPYYAWGLHINYIDQETYTIWAKEVNDKAGQFRTWILNIMHMDETPDGRTTAGDWDVNLGIDEKVRHASKSQRIPGKELFIFAPASRIGLEYYTQSNFLQLSK